jgi:hypothetical protein
MIILKNDKKIIAYPENYLANIITCLLGMGGAYERLVKNNKCRLSNEMNG